ENRVDHWHQQERDECCHAEAADLCVTHRFPEWTTVRCEWEQRDYCRSNRNHHWSQTHDPGIQQRFDQRRTFGVFLFDEVKQHDNVTDDYTDKTHYPKERHEAKRLAHNPQRCQRAHHAERHRRKHDEWFDRILELKHQRHEYQQHGNRQHDHQVPETLDLVFFFAADFHPIARRHFFSQLVQLRSCRFHH